MPKEQPTQSIDPKRRKLLGAAVSGAVLVPLASLLGARSARAAEKLSEDDSQAKALHYVHDASDAKHDSYDKGELCKNCNLIQSDSGEWRPCAIFPGKLVNEDGWCSAYVKKAGT